MHWTDLLVPNVPILEKILRPIAVYLFLLVAFHLAGKRELGQMTPFDLIVLLTISNVLQNAMIGDDTSLTGGLIGASALFVVNFIGVRLPWLERRIEGDPTPLIEDGRILEANLKKERLDRADLERALRKHGLDPERDLRSIKRALLETDGAVTILRYEPNAGTGGAT